MITPSTDQLKARILSNEKVFKAWGYYNMAKKVYDKVSIQNIVSESEVAPVSKGPYRPKQWDNLPTDLSQLVLVKTNIGGFFFDAIIRTEHNSDLKITSHPVQTGANITDHSFLEGAVVVMEIGMSDAMDSLVPNQFTGKYTKSVSAFQVLSDLQADRIPLSVTTRIRTYQNMLIETINVPDDVKTLNGLRCTVTLKEVFVVEVARTKVSARPHAMNNIDRGHIQAEKIDPGTLGYQIENR